MYIQRKVLLHSPSLRGLSSFGMSIPLCPLLCSSVRKTVARDCSLPGLSYIIVPSMAYYASKMLAWKVHVGMDISTLNGMIYIKDELRVGLHVHSSLGLSFGVGFHQIGGKERRDILLR